MLRRFVAVAERTVLDQDYSSSRGFDFPSDFLLLRRNKGGYYHAAVGGMVEAVLELLSNRSIIVGAMNYQRIFERIPQMEKVAVGLHFAVAYEMRAGLSEEVRAVSVHCQPVWIHPDVLEHVVQTVLGKDDSVVVITFENLERVIIAEFAPLGCYTAFEFCEVIAEMLRKAFLHMHQKVDMVWHDAVPVNPD